MRDLSNKSAEWWDHYRARKRRNVRDWYQRHRDEILQKLKLARLEQLPPLPKSGYQIVGLSDPRDTSNRMRYLAIQHTDKPNCGWLIAWQNCKAIESKLASFFRELCAARVLPKETVIIGNVPLTGPLARRLLRPLIARYTPDLNVVARGWVGRPIVAISDDRSLRGFGSIAEAAEGLGMGRDAVARRLATGKGLFDGTIITTAMGHPMAG